MAYGSMGESNGHVTWPMTSRNTERSSSWPHYAQGPISLKQLEMVFNNNCSLLVYCEAVRLAILATRLLFFLTHLINCDIEGWLPWTTYRKPPTSNSLLNFRILITWIHCLRFTWCSVQNRKVSTKDSTEVRKRPTRLWNWLQRSDTMLACLTAWVTAEWNQDMVGHRRTGHVPTRCWIAERDHNVEHMEWRDHHGELVHERAGQSRKTTRWQRVRHRQSPQIMEITWETSSWIVHGFTRVVDSVSEHLGLVSASYVSFTTLGFTSPPT